MLVLAHELQTPCTMCKGADITVSDKWIKHPSISTPFCPASSPVATSLASYSPSARHNVSRTCASRVIVSSIKLVHTTVLSDTRTMSMLEPSAQPSPKLSSICTSTIASPSAQPSSLSTKSSSSATVDVTGVPTRSPAVIMRDTFCVSASVNTLDRRDTLYSPATGLAMVI